MYENLRESYENNKLFFPNILRLGLFTIMLKDTIYFNSKSNFIQWHYHGTSRSLIQFRSHGVEGEPFSKVDISQPVRTSKKSKKLSPLPTEYTTVKDQFRKRGTTENLWAPVCTIVFTDIIDLQVLDVAFTEEIEWLVQVYNDYNNRGSQDQTMCNGWAAHYASKKRGHQEYTRNQHNISSNKRQGCNA